MPLLLCGSEQREARGAGWAPAAATAAYLDAHSAALISDAQPAASGGHLGGFGQLAEDFTATTLSRFYAIHMMLVPGLIGALIGAHLYLVAKLGTSAPPWKSADLPPNDEKRV